MNTFKKSFLAFALCAALATPTETKPMAIVAGIAISAVIGVGIITKGIYNVICYESDLDIDYYTFTIKNKKRNKTLSQHTITTSDTRMFVDECIKLCATFDPCTQVFILTKMTLDNGKVRRLSPLKLYMPKTVPADPKYWIKTKRILELKYICTKKFDSRAGAFFKSLSLGGLFLSPLVAVSAAVYSLFVVVPIVSTALVQTLLSIPLSLL